MSLRHSPQDFMLLARKAYDIYKAINDRQESVPRQLQLLGDELRHLDERLRELCRALEQHETSTYDGYDAFKRTLDECQDFVDRFIAFNRPGAIAVRRWLSIGKYTFDYDSIKSLQLEAAGHVQYIIFVQNNLALATVSELLKRRKEIMHMGPEAEPTRTNFQLNVEIDELATRIEAILARTLLPPLQRDVTDNRVEIPSGAGEQAAYGQKWTLNAVLQQPHQPDDHPETSGLPELHTRPFVEDLASSVKARNTLRVRGSVSQLMDRLAFSRHNSRDEDGLRELSGIAVEAQQLLSRSRDSQKRTAIQSTDPNSARISASWSRPRWSAPLRTARPSLGSIEPRSVFSPRTVDTALTVPTPRPTPAACATTKFSPGSVSLIPEPALMTLLSAVPVKFRTSDMKRGPMDCGVDICSDGFNFSLTVSLSNGVKYVEYLQDAPIPHVEYPDDDRPRVVSDRDTSRVVSVSFPGRRNVYRESPQTPTQRIEVDVKYFFGSERRSYEFQEKIYGKKLLECVRVDSVKLDGRIMCQIQPLRIWMGRNGICTAMFFANSLKEKKGRLYLEYEIIGAEPVKLVKKAPVRLHVAAESETGDRKPNIHQRRTSFTPVLSTASKKSTSSVRKTSRSELTLDVVVTSACDRRALKRALQIALKDDMTYVKNLQTPQSAQESAHFLFPPVESSHCQLDIAHTAPIQSSLDLSGVNLIDGAGKDDGEEGETKTIGVLNKVLHSRQASDNPPEMGLQLVNLDMPSPTSSSVQPRLDVQAETISDHSPKAMDEPSDRCVDKSNSDNTRRPFLDQSVSVQWTCRCGESFQEDKVEQIAAAGLIRMCTTNDATPDLEMQQPQSQAATASGSAQGLSTSSSFLSARRPNANLLSEQDRTMQSDSTNPHSTDTDDRGKWVLLCLPGKGSDEVQHANVKTATCNQSMYRELHYCYYSRVRWWIRWLTLRKLDSIDFVRFHVYWRNNVNIEIIDYGSLPPPHTADYELDRTATKPPIFRTALAHFIQHPLHAPIGVQHLKRMSKKVGARVTKTKHGKDDNSEEELEGWGLHVRERVCWKQVSIVLATLGSGSLAFAIVWCVKYGVGLQDGFTVAGVMVAYGTIILGVLHSAALTQSQSHS